MRAVIYARYSSDLQSEASIEDQIRLCRERVEQENGTVVDIYTDYAISGGSVRNRPGMQGLLHQAKSGKFDHVIAEALDRVSRDQEDIAAIYKRLRRSDICLLTLAEGEISELHVGLKGTMNALFLKDLALKIRRGQRGRVEAGKIPGGSSYGYRIIRQLLPDGSVSTGEREIDLSQAAIIRRIFEEYADGKRPGKSPRASIVRPSRARAAANGTHPQSTATDGAETEFSATSYTPAGSPITDNAS
jgi:site-specific DNA recombinase